MDGRTVGLEGLEVDLFANRKDGGLHRSDHNACLPFCIILRHEPASHLSCRRVGLDGHNCTNTVSLSSLFLAPLITFYNRFSPAIPCPRSAFHN